MKFIICNLHQIAEKVKMLGAGYTEQVTDYRLLVTDYRLLLPNPNFKYSKYSSLEVLSDNS